MLVGIKSKINYKSHFHLKFHNSKISTTGRAKWRGSGDDLDGRRGGAGDAAGWRGGTGAAGAQSQGRDRAQQGYG